MLKFIKNVNNVGRVVIPLEFRTKFKLHENDLVEMFSTYDSIILRKYKPNCIFCGATKKLVSYNDKLVCTKCAEQLKKLAEK